MAQKFDTGPHQPHSFSFPKHFLGKNLFTGCLRLAGFTRGSGYTTSLMTLLAVICAVKQLVWEN